MLNALPATRVDFVYLPRRDLTVFTQVKAIVRSALDLRTYSSNFEGEALLEQAWVDISSLFDSSLAVRVGRQRFEDRREWWWREDLEAIRLHRSSNRFSGFLAISEQLWSASSLEALEPGQAGVMRLLAEAGLRHASGHEIHLRFLSQRDRSPSHVPGDVVNADGMDRFDAALSWIGIHYHGSHETSAWGTLDLNIDVACLFGEQSRHEFIGSGNDFLVVAERYEEDVQAWAIDATVSARLPVRLESYLTLGYALGSGDRSPGSGTHRDFRQSGLQRGLDNFRGNVRFEYHGETLLPELSNLRILTAAIGVPMGEHFWIETVLHDYHQQFARSALGSSHLDIAPNGIRRDIGREVDLILGIQYDRIWQLKLALGAFRAGAAFGKAQGEWARSASLRLTYNF